MQVKPKIGLTFAEALRSFLRADPDVVMIGEMRDLETAGIAIEASLTGHIVLSTLHTNTAPETITRLLDMGLDPFVFADSLLGILAQRLVRTLCTACKQPIKEKELVLKNLEKDYADSGKFHEFISRNDIKIFMPGADKCAKCDNKRYKGRSAIHELLTATPAIRDSVMQKAPVRSIREVAVREGMKTLRQDGIEKVLAGITTFDEIFSSSIL